MISGPSGAGKSTVVRELLENCPLPLVLSVSATTRQPRPGEVEGVDYFFLTHGRVRPPPRGGRVPGMQGSFRPGNWYGTLQSQVASGLAAGKWVLLEIDVEGRWPSWSSIPSALTIFIHSGSIEELERRLRQRNTETEDVDPARLEVARRELAFKTATATRSSTATCRRPSRDLRNPDPQSRQGVDQCSKICKEEGIVNKVGGRFKLSTLIQKRLVQLNAGSRPLVDLSTQDKMQVVLQEIMQDKIYLDATQQVRIVGEFQGTGESMELDLGDL